MTTSRNYTNLIEAIVDASDERLIPPEFQRWAAISAIAGAMGRKCWYRFGPFTIRPNLFIMLIGQPGVGKSSSLALPFDSVYDKISVPVEMARLEDSWPSKISKLGMDRPIFRIGDRITTEALGVALKRISSQDMRLSTLEDGGEFYDASLTVTASEFGVFMRREDSYLQRALTDLWDSKPRYEYRTKTSGSELIEGPCLNLLCCATPSEFVDNMPKNARGQGLLSRVLLIYSHAKPGEDDVEYKFPSDTELEYMTYDLGKIASLRGEFEFDTEDTKIYVKERIRQRMPPIPVDPNMIEYNTRRKVQAFKLAMIVSAAKNDNMKITRDDWIEAETLLHRAEELMPVALEMFGLSDTGKIARDLVEIIKSKGGNISRRRIMRKALELSRSPAEVGQMLTVMEEAGMIHIMGDKVCLATE